MNNPASPPAADPSVYAIPVDEAALNFDTHLQNGLSEQEAGPDIAFAIFAEAVVVEGMSEKDFAVASH